MRIFSFVNEKGGVGKTTTAVNLAYNLAQRGKNILLIDFDPQANSTLHLNVSSSEIKHTISDIISTEYQDGEPVFDSIIKKHGISIIPSSKKLAGLEGQCNNMPGKELVLKDHLVCLKQKKYDYVLIDCPGKPGFLTNNAICSSTDIITTVQAEFLSLSSVKEIMSTMRVIRKRLNVFPEFFGFVVTMYDKRKVLNNDVLNAVKKKFPNKILCPPIRDNVSLAEAPSHGLPIALYAPKSTGARDYEELTDSFIQKAKEGIYEQ